MAFGIMTLLIVLFGLSFASFNSTPIANFTSISLSLGECFCAGGKVTVFNYEYGTGCLGACTGNPFEFHEFGSTVRELNVWLGGSNNGFRAVFIKLFNGKMFTVGKIPANGADGSFTFDAGESIVGSVEICGNGIGTRIGYLRFKTSKGREFKVGQEHTPYYFESGDSYLTGIFGLSGDEIFQMGLLFMKPIKLSTLKNIKYPTIDTYRLNLAPKIYRTTLCNDDESIDQTQAATFTKTIGEKRNWSMKSSFFFEEDIHVVAGVPEIATVDAKISWKISEEQSFSRETDTTNSQMMSYPVKVAHRSRMTAQFSWWDSPVEIPYTGELHLTFKSGEQTVFPISDIYRGAYISDVVGSYHETPLAPEETCAQLALE